MPTWAGQFRSNVPVKRSLLKMINDKGRTIRKVMGGRGIFKLQEFFFVIKFFA